MGFGDFLSNIFGTQNQFSVNSAPYSQNLQSVYNNQSGLASELQTQAAGGGPNPAQIMLNQATENNNKMNAGFVASQKGINPATAQRLAVTNNAQSNQTAAGQGSLMDAEQQLSAEKELSGIYGQQGTEQLGGLTNANNINAGVSNQNTQTAGQIAGGVLNGAGSIGAAAVGFAHGGEVGPVSHFGKSLKNPMMVKAMVSPGEKIIDPSGKSKMVPGHSMVKGDSKRNDTVKANIKSGSMIEPRSVVGNKDKEKKFVEAVLARKGLKK